MDFTKIELLHDRVIIEKQPIKKRDSGLVDTTDYSKFPPEGTVVAIGNGKLTGEPDHVFSVKVGDKVKYERHGGNEYTENYLLMRESNIITILKQN